MSGTQATDICPDCGVGIVQVITEDGAEWLHLGPFDAQTDTQHAYDTCGQPEDR